MLYIGERKPERLFDFHKECSRITYTFSHHDFNTSSRLLKSQKSVLMEPSEKSRGKREIRVKVRTQMMEVLKVGTSGGEFTKLSGQHNE